MDGSTRISGVGTIPLPLKACRDCPGNHVHTNAPDRIEAGTLYDCRRNASGSYLLITSWTHKIWGVHTDLTNGSLPGFADDSVRVKAPEKTDFRVFKARNLPGFSYRFSTGAVDYMLTRLPARPLVTDHIYYAPFHSYVLKLGRLGAQCVLKKMTGTPSLPRGKTHTTLTEVTHR